MKKILLLLIMMFPFIVNAQEGYYDSVNIEVSFAKEININNVGGIVVEVTDQDNNMYEFEMNSSNSFKTSTKDLFTYTDLVVQASGNDGNTYELDTKIDYSNDLNPVIRVLVTNMVTSADNIPNIDNVNDYSEEEIQKAQESLKAKNSRYLIYKIVFISVLLFVLIVLCIAGIKILNANK